MVKNTFDYEKFANDIKNFPQQFEFDPKVENGERLGKYDRFIMAGMGGSALAADLLRVTDLVARLFVYRDYWWPETSNFSSTLVIASSYSGNTEETLDVFCAALTAGFPAAAISVGGPLLEMAKDKGAPYIQLPDTGIQPRIAVGLSLKAILKLMGEEERLKEIGKLSKLLDAEAAQKEGEELTKKMQDKIPIVYASAKNFPLAYNWKLKFNETAKIPAFCNFFPELNHNEMTGLASSPKALAEKFYFIFLEDEADDPRITKRMRATRMIYEEKGFGAESVSLAGKNIWRKIFSNVLVADYAALYLAKYYGADPEQIPVVEEFKKMIKKQE